MKHLEIKQNTIQICAAAEYATALLKPYQKIHSHHGPVNRSSTAGENAAVPMTCSFEWVWYKLYINGCGLISI